MPFGNWNNFAECKEAMIRESKKNHPKWTQTQHENYAGGTCYEIEQRSKSMTNNEFQAGELGAAAKKHNEAIRTGKTTNKDKLVDGTRPEYQRNAADIQTGSTTKDLNPGRDPDGDGDDDRYKLTDIDGDSSTTVIAPGKTIGIKKGNFRPS